MYSAYIDCNKRLQRYSYFVMAHCLVNSNRKNDCLRWNDSFHTFVCFKDSGYHIINNTVPFSDKLQEWQEFRTLKEKVNTYISLCMFLKNIQAIFRSSSKSTSLHMCFDCKKTEMCQLAFLGSSMILKVPVETLLRCYDKLSMQYICASANHTACLWWTMPGIKQATLKLLANHSKLYTADVWIYEFCPKDFMIRSIYFKRLLNHSNKDRTNREWKQEFVHLCVHR